MFKLALTIVSTHINAISCRFEGRDSRRFAPVSQPRSSHCSADPAACNTASNQAIYVDHVAIYTDTDTDTDTDTNATPAPIGTNPPVAAPVAQPTAPASTPAPALAGGITANFIEVSSGGALLTDPVNQAWGEPTAVRCLALGCGVIDRAVLWRSQSAPCRPT